MESDDNFHSLIKRGVDEGAVEIACHARILTSHGTPIQSWADNNVPPLLLIALVAVNFYLVGFALGFLSLVCCAVFFIFYVRRWIRRRMRKRGRALALASADNWMSLWDLGGLSIRLVSDPEVDCDSPDGDWAGFVRDHLTRREPNEIAATK